MNNNKEFKGTKGVWKCKGKKFKDCRGVKNHVVKVFVLDLFMIQFKYGANWI